MNKSILRRRNSNGVMLKSLVCIVMILHVMATAGAHGVDVDRVISTDSRIKTFIYSQNEVFPVVLHYGYQTSIEFALDESVQSYSVGNSYAWQISMVDNSMFMKPLEENVMTNMTVITNKRKYYFELVSKSMVRALDEEMAYAIRFFYHDDDSAHTLSSLPIVGENAADRIVPYNFNYDIAGNKELAPKSVFDDGIKTYFQYERLPKDVPTIRCIRNKGAASNMKLVQEGNTFAVSGICGKFKIGKGAKAVFVSFQGK